MVRLLLERETRRPLVLIVVFFQLAGMGGMMSIRPFLIEVLDAFHVPLNANWSTVVMTVTGFLGSLLLIVFINRVGKRVMALSSSAVCAACCLLLGVYAYLFITPEVRAGNQSYIMGTWVPLVLFAIFAFAAMVQGQIPWQIGRAHV